MRRLARVALLCLGCGLCSLLYAFSQLALSLEQEVARRQHSRDSALPLRRQLGGEAAGWTRHEGKPRMGRPERCKNVSVSYWNSYWMLPPDVCGKNCFWEAARSPPLVFADLSSVDSGICSWQAFGEVVVEEEEELDSLAYQEKFNYTLYPISFPTENAAEWKKLFKPCASQRLFLPLILSDVDSLLYVDTDILFLRPVDDIWSFLKKFNSSQIAAMAPEHEEPRIGWYNRFARHPYYGKTGINSGVMLMNMTRIRRKYFKNDMTTVRLRWEQILMPLLKKYKLNITWGDQDLLNIMFFHNPVKMLICYKKAFLFFLVNGTIGLTTVFMGAIANKLKKKEYSSFMETEVFTMMISNQLFELCMMQ
ncbi:hypothetical protein JD844_027858 [Phrynosoma platyrhinos]|uniref:Glucoside xylosyltransferase 1 n=1 Tax=Phrynosoma platyrhinos TaxID=52577 RepID=A0ABQ7SH28_PHRPL|nr:hypothetical protein JD844_027858 [Phrynosoma platyrhinos]